MAQKHRRQFERCDKLRTSLGKRPHFQNELGLIFYCQINFKKPISSFYNIDKSYLRIALNISKMSITLEIPDV